MDASKPGTKLREQTSGVEVIVVKPPSEPVLTIEPGGELLMGKRYTCGTCSAQVLVVKGGAAAAQCHGAPMEMAQPKSLPSSD